MWLTLVSLHFADIPEAINALRVSPFLPLGFWDLHRRDAPQRVVALSLGIYSRGGPPLRDELLYWANLWGALPTLMRRFGNLAFEARGEWSRWSGGDGVSSHPL